MYHNEEVELLVEDRLEHESTLEASPRKLWILVRLSDVDVAERRLSMTERRVLFLCGKLGFSTRDAGELLHVSHETVWRHYKRSVRKLQAILNGDVCQNPK